MANKKTHNVISQLNKLATKTNAKTPLGYHFLPLIKL